MEKLDFRKNKDELIRIAKERKITFDQVARTYELNKTLISNYEAARVLNREKMLKDVEEFNDGKCLFYPDENRAYLRLNKNMEYVYISERKKENTYLSLNLLEMAEVVLEIDFYEALISLIYSTGILTVENMWIEKHRNIYKENKTKIKDIRGFWIADIVKDYEALIEIADENLKRGWVNSINIYGKNYPYITVSNIYFSEKTNKKVEPARKSLIYLEALGLIEKLEPEEIADKVPKKLPKKFNKSIGVYRIVEATPLVISEAIERIKTLKILNITKGNIARKDLEIVREGGIL